MQLPSPLLAAVQEAKAPHQHEARRRQMQYIGRLMRATSTLEADTRPPSISELGQGRGEHTARLHTLERWREELLAGDPALAPSWRIPRAPTARSVAPRDPNARRGTGRALPPQGYHRTVPLLREMTTKETAADA
jgi:ribosome-associated protein